MTVHLLAMLMLLASVSLSPPVRAHLRGLKQRMQSLSLLPELIEIMSLKPWPLGPTGSSGVVWGFEVGGVGIPSYLSRAYLGLQKKK